MISQRILTKTCSLKELSGNTYDAVGCPTGDLYGVSLSGIPCYYTQISYETLPGSEPIKNVYRMYVNAENILSVNTNFKIFVDNKIFDILDIENAFGQHHYEFIIKEISI